MERAGTLGQGRPSADGLLPLPAPLGHRARAVGDDLAHLGIGPCVHREAHRPHPAAHRGEHARGQGGLDPALGHDREEFAGEGGGVLGAVAADRRVHGRLHVGRQAVPATA